ncbi:MULTISPECIES: DUF1656 domain-containing protein [Cupriavidus]|uniref:Protein AaeX n=1 Tax=Cupriavidus numazuensis TaxID=221992 RepID=A0ABM8TMC6_9BURK|nr:MULTISPECIES: DUF1656 domain-containing protein [Cupriavidus]MBP0623181.1 DUF1656 domain-containing protein [Cupriavidus sp. LEh25]MDK2659875.1 DUF1656 domain-containing protein [Cupriavidus sp. LEh21]CAG2154134.1 Protein AaeX [Cupriavidus numazuensis]
MYGEFNLYGVFIPTLLGLMLLAYALKGALRSWLTRTGLYRWIWHPALFNLAMYIAVLGMLISLMHWMQS